MKRAVIYCRISDDRDGEGLGVARQEKDCRQLADHLGWDVAAVHVDNDISAYNGKHRPGYQAVLHDLDTGAADALIVWKPDRLHRRPVELEHFIDLVERHGVAVATVAGGTIDLSTSEGRAMARVIGAFARMESEVKADRTRRKHLELAERGVAVGGFRPFGYDDDKITIRPDEADLVRDAARRVLAGATIRGVVVDWNRQGILTTRGGRWNQTGLRRVLTSWRVAGVRALGDAPVARGAWPAIIDDATHQRLRAVLLAPGRTLGGYGPRTHVLTGILACWRCRQRLVAKQGANRRRSYGCTNNPDRGGCGGVRIVADDLEALIAELVFDRIDSPEFALAVAAQSRVPAVDDPTAEVAALEQKLTDLAGQWAADELGKAEWLTARRAVDARLTAARRRLARFVAVSAPGVAVGSGAALRARWEAADGEAGVMSIDEKHAVLRVLIDHVTVGPAVRGWNRFDAGRITPAGGGEITWNV